MKHLMPIWRGFKKESIIAPLFKMLEAFFDLLVPIVVSKCINVGIHNADTKYIIICCLLMITMAVIGLLCSFTAQYFAAKAAVGCSTRLRHNVFAHIQNLGYTELDTIGTSTLITRMTSDINQVQNGVNMFLRLFLRSPFIIIGAVIMAFMIDTRMAWFIAASVPVLTVVIVGVMKWTGPKYKKVQNQLDHVMSDTRENLAGVRVIRAFSRENDETETFQQDNDALLMGQRRVGRISALMNPMTYVIVNLTIIAILTVGSNQIDRGLLLNGSLIALVNYMSQILIELVKLANLVVTLSRAMASMNRVGEVLETKPSMQNRGDRAEQTADCAVRFENVSLQYAGAGAESISGISFCAKPGQTIGIIGGTGSGKSSLVNLIPRFYDATAGAVEISGIPISEWNLEALRRYVGIVPQRAQLFAGTIRSNLQWGNENATDEMCWAALKTTQAEEFVRSKPLGLDEPIEQGGRNLSGGQKQRLTIARALISNPKILILDDSASALDYATDAALRKAIRTLPEDMTVFIVSQRTSSMMDADLILVLEDGMLVDAGTHAALLERCSLYQEIYESQFRRGDAK